MLRSCLPYLGSPDCVDNITKDESRSKELGEGHHNNSPAAASSFVSSSINSKHIFVRVVHAGGKVDHYPNAVLAAKLLETLPGKWLTHPQVFKQPHHSIIYPQQYLLPGHKYYVIPLSTIDKLLRKHSNTTIKFLIPPNNNINNNQQAVLLDNIGRDSEEANIIDHSMDHHDFSTFYSAREFYANKHKRPMSSEIEMNGSSGGSRKPRILKPKPKPKPKPKSKPCTASASASASAYTWEPGLTSIQELSP